LDDARKTQVANFDVAVTRRVKNGDGTVCERTTLHKVVAYGALAVAVHAEYGPGDFVLVRGFHQDRKLTSRDGAECVVRELVAEESYLLMKNAKNSAKRAEETKNDDIGEHVGGENTTRTMPDLDSELDNEGVFCPTV
jgi:single-stranded DNA-binding protein